MPGIGNLHLPSHVLVLAPDHRHLGLCAGAVPSRTAPSWPILGLTWQRHGPQTHQNPNRSPQARHGFLVSFMKILEQSFVLSPSESRSGAKHATLGWSSVRKR